MTTPQYEPLAYQFAPQPPQKPGGTNGFAIAALVLAIVPAVGGILGFIFGLIGLHQIRRTGQKGRGLAIAALSIVAGWWILGGTVVAVDLLTDAKRDSSGAVTGGGNVSANELRVGDCLKDLKEDQALVEVPVVPCAQPHTGEIVGSYEMPGSAYPGEEMIATQAGTQCDILLNVYSSRRSEPDDMFIVYPSQTDWNKGSRTVTCMAYFSAPVSGSLRG